MNVTTSPILPTHAAEPHTNADATPPFSNITSLHPVNPKLLGDGPADLNDSGLSADVVQMFDNWHDATVWGDLSRPDVAALLDQMTIYGVTRGAPRVGGGDWTQFEAPWRGAIDGVLTRHPEQAKKGGNAFYFGEGDLTGQMRGKQPICFKMKGMIRRVFALQIDVDGGCTVEAVVQRVRDQGLFAIIYTTHSNLEKGGPGSERFRVILPFAEPFTLRADPNGKKEWGPDYAEWCGKYVGVVKALIPSGGNWDTSAMRPSQLMYAPARPIGAEFKHYVIAGRGLDLSTVPMGDASAYAKRAPAESARGTSFDGKPAFLSDGFDLIAWHQDHGQYFMMESFLDWIGWDVLSAAGGGFEVLCPQGGHTSGGDTAWAIDGLDARNGAAIYCHHDHCSHLRTWDFLRMLEDQTGLPEGVASLSALMCDPSLYPSEVDGVAVSVSVYDYGVLRPVHRLGTADAVQKAWLEMGEIDDTARAALCAGVILAKNKNSAKNKLNELFGGNGRHREAYWKAGESHLTKWQATQKTKPDANTEKTFTLSLDPSDPLGNDPAQKFKTLSARFRLVNYKGKTLVVRTVDREGIEMGDSILEFWTKDSLKQFYAHEAWPEGEGKDVKWVNPVNRWWDGDAKRHTRVVFDPSDRERPNDVNLYDASKRSLVPMQGDASPITNFIRNIVCNGDSEVYNWVILWLAHLMQRPWERPGTAIVLYGKGGAGKGTFVQIARNLVAPYDMLATDPSNLVGQFAGPNLATSLVVGSEEAVYAKDPAIADKLKGMITQKDMQVEAKGFQSVQMDVFFRIVIDSNHDSAVRIEGNNSERRYLVSNVSEAMVGDEAGFKDLYAHINGPAMQAFMHDLLQYVPTTVGGWNSVRTAPETIYRKQMFVEGLKGSDKAFLRMLEDGEFVWRDGQHTFRIELKLDDENRIPARALDAFVTSLAGRYDSDLRPAAAVWKRLFADELPPPKAARSDGERQVFDEDVSEGRSDYEWQAMGFNTSMYHLPSLTAIRERITARTGIEHVEDAKAPDIEPVEDAKAPVIEPAPE